MFNARPERYIYNERNDNRPPVAHAPGNAEQELIACAQQQSKRQSLTRYLSGQEKTPSASARFPTGPMPRVHARASRHLCGNKQSRAVGDVAAAPLRSFCVGHPRRLAGSANPARTSQHIAFLSLGRPVYPPAPGGLGLMSATAAMQAANAALEHNYTFARVYSCTFN